MERFQMHEFGPDPLVFQSKTEYQYQSNDESTIDRNVVCCGDGFEWVCVQFDLIRHYVLLLFMDCCYNLYLLAKQSQQRQQTILNKNTDWNFNGNEAKYNSVAV